MKRIKYIVLAVLLMSVASCDNSFDEINSNPNTTTKGSSSMITTAVIGDLFSLNTVNTIQRANSFTKYTITAGSNADEIYNRYTSEYDINFEDYLILNNLDKIMELAPEALYDSYNGFTLFMKALRLFYVSILYGDIPYSEALGGEKGIVAPKYDTQKEVMIHILNDLDEAYNSFNKSTGTLEGDYIFNGNTENWKKIVSAFELNVLIQLSIKESDPDLRVKERFAKIVAERPLLASNEDNMRLVFKNQSGMLYYYNRNNNATAKLWLTSLLVDLMKKYKDYKLFYYATPAEALTEQGIPSDSWDAYSGVDPSIPYSDITAKVAEGSVSTINPRYTDYAPGEPYSKIGYVQQNFILAEGAVRGWLPGKSASDYYLKGIEASLQLVKDATPDDPAYHNGKALTDAMIKEQLALPEIQLTGNFDDDLRKILEQKYICSFMQYRLDPYFDYRRTGYPVFPINPETNLNTMPDRLPARLMYPSSELSYNQEHYKEAIDRQFNGNDEVNQLMWILIK
ncbi:MAG: SusD/RagB family nutrient-binding outer membrane lipoprotein [Tannerella sp.]|nr:SusD/RagB family nutrient-binding outer membrane lipoprotein [Tannerella sp.]